MSSQSPTANGFSSPNSTIRYGEEQEKTPPTARKTLPSSPSNIRRKTATPKYVDRSSPTQALKKPHVTRRLSSCSLKAPPSQTPQRRRPKSKSFSFFSPLNPLSGNVNNPSISPLNHRTGNQYRSVVTGKSVQIEDSDEESSYMVTDANSSHMKTPTHQRKALTSENHSDSSYVPENSQTTHESTKNEGASMPIQESRELTSSKLSETIEKENKRKAQNDLQNIHKQPKFSNPSNGSSNGTENTTSSDVVTASPERVIESENNDHSIVQDTQMEDVPANLKH